MNNITELILAGTGLYEVAARSIKTKKSYSIIHGILKALVMLSGLIDNRKGKVNNTLPLLVAAAGFSLASCSTLKKVECVSKKYVTVTYLTNEGKAYSLEVPYCDTIRLKKGETLDTATIQKMNNELLKKAAND